MSAIKSNSLCRDQCEQLTSTYHPNGMLDRDQRTAKTLSEFSKTGSVELYSLQTCSQSINKCCYKMLHNSNVNVHKSSTSCNQHRRQQTESVLLIYNCCNNSVTYSNKNQSDSYRKSNNNLFHCQLPPVSNALNSQTSNSSRTQNGIQQNLQKCKSYTKSKSLASPSYALSSSSCSKSMKFSNLLVCICLWLLISQKTRAMPMSPSCETYMEAFKPILDQAKMSYVDNLKNFMNFTKMYFQQDHKSVLEAWKDGNIISLKPSTQTSRQKEPQFYDRTDDEVLAHLKGGFSKMTVRQELQELYERLAILEHAFTYITDESNVIDDYEQKFYESHLSYLKMLKEEVGDSLDKLNIKRPDVTMPDVSLSTKELRDYYVMREHLIVLKYVIDAYELLKSTCPTDI